MKLLWLRVAGRSMWPLAHPLQVGVEPRAAAGQADLQIGDVIAVLGDQPGTVVVHRLQAIDGELLILRGDTNSGADRPVQRSAVLGRVKALRLGPLVCREPQHPMLSAMLRQGGLAWARWAPQLRASLRRLRRHHRQTRHNVDMPGD